MNSKVLILIMESIPKPVKLTVTYTYDAKGKNIQNKLYRAAKIDVVRELILSRAHRLVKSLSEKDIEKISSLCATFRVKNGQNISHKIFTNNDIVSVPNNNDKPYINGKSLIILFKWMSKDNQHFDAVKERILTSIEEYISPLDIDEMAKLLDTFKNTERKFNVFDLLMGKVPDINNDHIKVITDQMETPDAKELVREKIVKHIEMSLEKLKHDIGKTYENGVEVEHCFYPFACDGIWPKGTDIDQFNKFGLQTVDSWHITYNNHLIITKEYQNDYTKPTKIHRVTVLIL